MNVMQWQAIHWNSDTIACPLVFLEQYRYHLCTDLSETVLVFPSVLQAFRWNNVETTNSHSFRSNTSKIFSEKKNACTVNLQGVRWGNSASLM
jgi:hypothetical protein